MSDDGSLRFPRWSGFVLGPICGILGGHALALKGECSLPAGIIGGLLVGLFVGLLFWAGERSSPQLGSETLEGEPAPADPKSDKDGAESIELPRAPNVGLGLPVVALTLPVVALIALLFVTSIDLALVIVGGTVVATSLLMSIDAWRLGDIDRVGRRRAESPGGMFLGMCLFWIVIYPIVFFRRRHFVRPNLGPPAILVVLIFAGVPTLLSHFVSRTLPACDSREVADLLESLLREAPNGPRVKSIAGHREVSHDPGADRRQGQCVVHVDGPDIVVNYLVEWRDREKGQFVVRIIQ